MSKSSEKSKKAATTKKRDTGSKKSTDKPKTKKKTAESKTKAKAPRKKTSPVKTAPIKQAIAGKADPKKTTGKKTVSRDISERDRAILSDLEKEVKSEDEQVCLGAVERLGTLKHPDATRVLIIALADPRYMVRIHAAAQLGERKDKRSVDALVESLNDDSVFVRQTVAGALENIGGPKAKKAISKAEKDGMLLDELPEGKRIGE